MIGLSVSGRMKPMQNKRHAYDLRGGSAMSGQRAKLSLGQVLLVSLGCGLVMVLIIFAVQIATGNQEVNRVPTLKTAAVMGVFTTLTAAYICLKHFWDRST
jgi:hypothetical protein